MINPNQPDAKRMSHMPSFLNFCVSIRRAMQSNPGSPSHTLGALQEEVISVEGSHQHIALLRKHTLDAHLLFGDLA